MRILALDLSLTETGWVAKPQTGVLRPPRSHGSGTRRLAWFRDQVIEACRFYRPDLAVIEGYAYGMARGASQSHSLGELGGVVRLVLHDLHIPVAVVAPATLKKYATGRGNARKEEVLVAAVKRLGYQEANHNVADALWLRQMAADHYGMPGAVQMPKAQRAALEVVEWPQITAEMTVGGVR